MWRDEDRELGEAGERATAIALSELERDGWRTLHDLPIGKGRTANIDHVCIGPGGVWVVETKTTAGTVEVDGRQLLINGSRRGKAFWAAAVRSVSSVRELDVIAPIRPSVRPCIVFHADAELDEVRNIGDRGGCPLGSAEAIVAMIRESELSPTVRRLLGRPLLGDRAIAQIAERIPVELADLELDAGDGEGGQKPRPPSEAPKTPTGAPADVLHGRAEATQGAPDPRSEGSDTRQSENGLSVTHSAIDLFRYSLERETKIDERETKIDDAEGTPPRRVIHDGGDTPDTPSSRTAVYARVPAVARLVGRNGRMLTEP